MLNSSLLGGKVTENFLNLLQLSAAVVLSIVIGWAWWSENRNKVPGPARIRGYTISGWIALILLALNLGWLGGRVWADTTRLVAITSPRDGQAVDARVVVKGRVGYLPSGQGVWVLVQPSEGGPILIPNKPAYLQPDGTWSTLLFVGSESDHGKDFTLIVVLATEQSMITHPAQVNGAGSGVLPPGVVVLDRVTVTRR